MSTDKEQMKCLYDIRNFIKNKNFKSIEEVITAFSNIQKSSFCNMTPDVEKEVNILVSEIESMLEKSRKQEGGKRRKTRKMRKQKGGQITIEVAILVSVIAMGFLFAVQMNQRDEGAKGLRLRNAYGQPE